MQLENEIHARNVKLIVAALIALVVICLVAMFFGRFETVDTIIDSVFKALAGAGVIGFLTRRKTNKE
ncbi:hypothetical protein [Grimontia hollisae]|uniref:hypothetical protein n=1 Tax=Grimontia hollisae TaxID=673 RepID=UPI0012ACFDE0|nr:hypothetical protein [Grimontia hollisae]